MSRPVRIRTGLAALSLAALALTGCSVSAPSGGSASSPAGSSPAARLRYSAAGLVGRMTLCAEVVSGSGSVSTP